MSAQVALKRLQQMTHHIFQAQSKKKENLSILHGNIDKPLLYLTLGELLDKQTTVRGDSECLVVPFTKARWTYSHLQAQSMMLAKGLLRLGIQHGDRIGILAGNCEEYAAIFFGAGYIGAILVVLNSTYTATEAQYALKYSGCKVLFTEEKYGHHQNTDLLHQLEPIPPQYENLERVVMLRGVFADNMTYEDVIGGLGSDELLNEARRKVHTHDVCNLQFTSGSTGHPKAAMLTHHNLINNSWSIGDRLDFTSSDILCCPPPLFHCFGLVLGLLAVITHGAKIVFPSSTFSASAVLAVLAIEDCTALHGVPAHFEELLSLPRPAGWSCPRLRTGIVAGAPVPKALMKRMFAELGMEEFTSSYGLTEASPTCFNSTTFDSIHTRLTTVGKLLPHLHAKIVNREGNIVPVGTRGELCVAGYSLQRGYWENAKKTDEVMQRDETGVLWLHTGDEAYFSEDGYCSITGRFKDIIIRGGENIYPIEIETRLTAHPSGHINRAAVVGIKHTKYGEIVGAFLLPPATIPTTPRPTKSELVNWVREGLARHKAPVHIWWFGDEQVGMNDVPMTGSGKIKKHLLRNVAANLANHENLCALQSKENTLTGSSVKPMST